MRRLNSLAATLVATLAGAASLVHGASPVYVTPDVPTTVPGGATIMPWQIVRYDAVGPTYTVMLSVPGAPELDAIHKLDTPAAWLFSLRTPGNLGGILSADALPRDVIRFKGGVYAPFFCPGGLGVPAQANLDGVYLEGGDAGSLVASFDIPIELPPGGGVWYDPSDFIRFVPTGTACGSWALSPVNPVFDASASGTGIPASDNVIDGDRVAGKILLAIDVPSTLAPSAGPLTTYLPGQIASWDGATYDDFEVLSGWPGSSKVDGLATLSNPGMVPPTIKVNKAGAPPTDLVISWGGSCTDASQDYGIYMGTIGAWYSHKAIDCNDAGGDLQEQVTPANGNVYFLVVPTNYKGEGSYGTNSGGAQRPIGSVVCASPQLAISCP